MSKEKYNNGNSADERIVRYSFVLKHDEKRTTHTGDDISKQKSEFFIVIITNKAYTNTKNNELINLIIIDSIIVKPMINDYFPPNNHALIFLFLSLVDVFQYWLTLIVFNKFGSFMANVAHR